MVDIAEGEVVEVQGSATLPYKLRNIGGVYSCSCPAWINAGGPIDLRTCKHLKQYRGEAAEIARVGDAAKGGKPVKAPKAASAGGGDDDGDAGDGAPPVLLAHKWENDIDLVGWWISEKLDGVRAWWDGERFLSRLGNTFLAPEWFTKDLPKHPLDGELWLARKEFQRCVSIVRSANAGEQWKQVKYLIFDAPAVPGAFEQRVELVEKLFGKGQSAYAEPVKHMRCEGVVHLKDELARVEGLGGEGLMLRQPGSKYVNGRSTTLLKVKTFHDAEARVIAHEPGKGKHKGRLGALVCEMHNGVKFNVGTGFTDAERGDPPKIGDIVTYRYQELTKDGVPRFPSYVGLAIDKKEPTAPPTSKLPTTTPKPAPTTTALAATTSSSTTSKPASSSPAQPSKGATVFRRFEMDEKFWAIKLDGASHTVVFGKIGTDGQSKTKTFGSDAEAKKEADKLVAEKTKKGYEEVDAGDMGGGGGGDDDDDDEAAAPAPAPAPASSGGGFKGGPVFDDDDDDDGEAAAPAPKPPPTATAAAPATSTGARRFEMDEKFWTISQSGNAHTVVFGKIGTGGQSKTKTFGSEAEAKKEADKLIAEKTKKGYEEVGGGDDGGDDGADEEAPAAKPAAPPKVATLVTVTPTAVTQPSGKPVSGDDGKAVHEIVKALSDAWRKGRYSEINDMLDERCVFIKPNRTRVEGRKACADSYREFMERTKVLRFAENDHRVDLWGETAIASCRWEMTYVEGGRPQREKGTESLALAKLDGAWLVVWRSLDVIPKEPAPAPAAATTAVDDADDDDEDVPDSDEGDGDDD